MKAYVLVQFEAENTDGHSSSIVDLFDSLRSPITFLQELEWSDEYQNARFFTSLSKVQRHLPEGYTFALTIPLDYLESY